MAPNTSRKVANAILGIAAAFGLYVVVRDPVLRRRALRALKIGLTTTIPGYLVAEAERAWRETGPRAA